LNRTLNLLPNDEPYPTSYRAITPRASDARNLLNRVTLSATDVADSAVRMDTTFMMLGEAAGRQQP
jgi:FAD-dependent oxidoreductase family protein